MEVSIWWVAAASVAGAWVGFLLCAVLAMARDREPEESPLASGSNVQTLA